VVAQVAVGAALLGADEVAEVERVADEKIGVLLPTMS
jgi:hypothetical protein